MAMTDTGMEIGEDYPPPELSPLGLPARMPLPPMRLDPTRAAKQAALAQNVRANPALSMPSGGVGVDDPFLGGAGVNGAPVQGPTMPGPRPASPFGGGSAADMLARISEDLSKPPDASQYVEYAKQRGDKSDRDFLLGLQLSAMGGSAFAPTGSLLMQRGLKEGGDYEIPGGWGTVGREGNVLWNTAKQREAQLAHQQRLYQIKQEEETKQSVAQARLDALASAAADRQAASLDRNAQQTAQKNYQDEDRMQKIYEAQVKDYRQELDATQKTLQLSPDVLHRPLTGIEQQTLQVLLNKFLDPGSVVREGEFNRVAHAQGLYERAANVNNAILHGKPLSPQLVADINKMATFYQDLARSKVNKIGDETSRKAKERGLNPANVILDPYYTPKEVRDAARPQSGRGGTADAPIKVLRRAAAAQAGDQPGVIESPL